MKSNLFVLKDWNRGVWIVLSRNQLGEMVVEATGFPANTPSIVVCDAIQQARPGCTVFAKLEECPNCVEIAAPKLVSDHHHGHR